MQHKGTRKGGGGALERPQARILGAVPGPLANLLPRETPPPGPGPCLLLLAETPPHAQAHPSTTLVPAFLIGHSIHEGLFPALGRGQSGGDVRVSQWGSVPQALEPGARHGQGDHVSVVYGSTCLNHGNTSSAARKLEGVRPLQHGGPVRLEESSCTERRTPETQTGCRGGCRQEGLRWLGPRRHTWISQTVQVWVGA